MIRKTPPGPRDWVFGFSEMAKMKRDLLGYHEDLQRRFGDLVRVRVGPYHIWNLYHPDLVREQLVVRARSFQKFRRVRQVFRQWNGDSLLLTEGETWLRQRRLVQPAFAPKRFGAYADVMVERTEHLADEWLRRADGDRGHQLEVTQAMTDLTLEIIARTMFGADISGQTAEIGEAVAALSEIALHELQAPFLTPDWLPSAEKRRKRWAMKFLDETVWRLVREGRGAAGDRGDLLSMLLLAVDEEGTEQSQLTDVEVRNESMTLLLAGHDTTAAALTWAWYLLACHPVVVQRIQAEVDEAVGNSQRPLTARDLERLGFTERVVKESLRIYPPAPGVFLREATEDVDIGGYTVPRGDLVQPISWVVHHDARWFPDPWKFDPDRWLPERAEDVPAYAWLPFGAGPRVCVGQGFALLEMTLVIATLLRRFDVSLAPGQGQPELQMHMSLRPRGGLRIRWTTRGDKHSRS